MGHGEVQEAGTPVELLENKESQLSVLGDAMGDQARDQRNLDP